MPSAGSSVQPRNLIATVLPVVRWRALTTMPELAALADAARLLVVLGAADPSGCASSCGSRSFLVLGWSSRGRCRRVEDGSRSLAVAVADGHGARSTFDGLVGRDKGRAFRVDRLVSIY